MREFAQQMVALRAAHPVLQRRTFLNGRQPDSADVLWLRPDGLEMTGDDWPAPGRHVLGMLLDGDSIRERDARGEEVRGDTLLILLNASRLTVPFSLPVREAGQWECLIDSAGLCPTPPVPGGTTWDIQDHSAAVFRFVGRPAGV